MAVWTLWAADISCGVEIKNARVETAGFLIQNQQSNVVMSISWSFAVSSDVPVPRQLNIQSLAQIWSLVPALSQHCFSSYAPFLIKDMPPICPTPRKSRFSKSPRIFGGSSEAIGISIQPSGTFLALFRGPSLKC